jgi:hypothetical protein
MSQKQLSKEEIMDKFEIAFHNNNISDMEKYYVPTKIDNYYIDVALEEGKKDVFNFFVNKNVKPSLFAAQMARINGHEKLAMIAESYSDFRNKVNIKNVYHQYDRINKKFVWNPNISEKYQY